MWYEDGPRRVNSYGVYQFAREEADLRLILNHQRTGEIHNFQQRMIFSFSLLSPLDSSAPLFLFSLSPLPFVFII